MQIFSVGSVDFSVHKFPVSRVNPYIKTKSYPCDSVSFTSNSIRNMKIAPVIAYNNGYKIQSLKNQSPVQMKQKDIAFGGTCGAGWQQYSICILDANGAWLRELGEYFHKCDNATLREASKIRNFFDFVKKDTSQKAYEKLRGAVSEVLKDKNRWLSRIAELSVGEAKNTQNIAAEKLRVTNLFINMLDTKHVDNGILIHGNSREKQSFIDWLYSTPGLNRKEMTFNSKKPVESLNELVMYAENAKTAKSINNKRTLLQVNNLDDLLTNAETVENRRNISRFKSFIENVSDKYDTTIVTTTGRLLEDFEEASIAPHRFGLKVELTEHMTDVQRKELETLRGKVKYLDDKAAQVKKKFWSDNMGDIYIPLGGGC